jgi:hypothetical protein
MNCQMFGFPWKWGQDDTWKFLGLLRYQVWICKAGERTIETLQTVKVTLYSTKESVKEIKKQKSWNEKANLSR